MKICPHCNGRGWVGDNEDRCPECNGTGQVEDDDEGPALIREPDSSAQTRSPPTRAADRCAPPAPPAGASSAADTRSYSNRE